MRLEPAPSTRGKAQADRQGLALLGKSRPTPIPAAARDDVLVPLVPGRSAARCARNLLQAQLDERQKKLDDLMESFAVRCMGQAASTAAPACVWLAL